MNKYQKEIQKYTLEQEKEIINQLTESYKQALENINIKLTELMGRKDIENIQSIIYQKQYQQMLKGQIEDILDKMDSTTTIGDYLKTCYETGYVGTMYDISKQGIPMTFPINQNQMVKCFTNPNATYKNITDIVGFTNEKTTKLVMGAMSRGIASGSSYSTIAKDIENCIGEGYRRSLRIARTEGHRVQQSATYDAQVAAKEKGADVVKQWCSTLDGVTRPTHQVLDGQIKEIDEPFTNMYGDEAMFPSDFGIAAEDINCRCCLLERARWNLDEDELQTLKDRAEYFGLDKTDSFEEFKEKYLQNVTDEKDAKSIDEITSVESLKNYWNKKGCEMNIPDDYSVQALKDLSKGVEDTLDEFPFMKNEFKGFDTNETDASASFTGKILNVSEDYKQNEYGTVWAIERKNNGYHPKFNGHTEAYQTGCHELGHGIVNKFANDKYGHEDGYLFVSDEIEKSILNGAKKELKKEGTTMSMKELKASISEYATVRNGETISEAIADYMCNGDDAVDFSKAIVKEIKKRAKMT